MKTTKIIIAIIIILLLLVFFYVQNNWIDTENISVVSKKLPGNFNGFRIVHLSDLHNKEFGKNQSRLVKKIKAIKPDIIVITGDLVDCRRYDEKPSLELISQIVKISPVYYVPGNHELASGKYKTLKSDLEKYGVEILQNRNMSIYRGNQKINIVGIKDPESQSYIEDEAAIIREELKVATYGMKSGFNMLLSHRPEMFKIYKEASMDISFSGHAHGGQIRLPFIGGLFAPGQGILPKYTSGMYKLGDSVMIVSRGLGNSVFPLRLFDYPEMIVVSLFQ